MKKYFFLFLLLINTNLYAQEIKIGWIGPLTGDAAALGVDSLRAIKLKLKEVSDLNIKLLAEDDAYVTGKTVSAYNKLVHQDKVKILFVITYGGLFAIADKAQKDGVLLLDPLDCDERIAKLPENVLCVANLTEELGQLGAQHAVKTGAMPGAIFYFDGDPFMGNVAEATIEETEKLGGKFAYQEAFYSDTKDFKAMLLKAKARKVKSLFFYGYDNTGYALRQAKALGIDIKFYGLNTISSPGFLSLAGDAINGAYITTWFPPENEKYTKFLADFKEQFNRVPALQISTIPSYDLMELLIKSFKKNKLSYSDQNFIAATRKDLYQTKNYLGLSGNITIDADGVTRSLKNEIYLYDRGEFKK